MGRRDDDDTLEGPKPGKCLIGCTGLLVNLIHVSPIGLVQFADFVSDGARRHPRGERTQEPRRGWREARTD